MTTPIKVTVIHFDDEIHTVSSIPNSLFNFYVNRCEQWVDEGAVRYDRYVESFILRPPLGCPVAIHYRLTNDDVACKRYIDELNPETDIAIFDLMRDNPRGGIQPVGPELYHAASGRRIDESRLFILSGFPSLFDREFKDLRIPAKQKLLKPIPPTEVAARLVQVFPGHVRVNP